MKREESLTAPYMIGLILTPVLGWTSGTAMGYIAGTFLPDVIQKAAVITVYAMFASLLGSESRKNAKALLVLLVSAGLNSMLILLFGVGTGVSFLISMLAATIFGCFIYTDEEAGV